MFSKPSHYFFNITFDWADILDVLGMSKEDQSNLQISDEFSYISPNAYSAEGAGMNNKSAMFEYYVMPGVISNAGFKDDSSIFDFQYKKFFSTINLAYREILINKLDEDKSVSCLVERFAGNKQSIFTITYSDSVFDRRYASIVFSEECFNRQDAHKKWGGIDNVRLFRYFGQMGEENKVEEVTVPKSLFLNILLQSEHDASSGPDVHRLVIDAL